MLRKFNQHSEDMLLAVVVWLCSLPLIGLLIIPVWGFKTAVLLALVVFLAIMIACWSICGWKMFKS